MDLNELLECERAGWQSLCDGSGAEFYGEIMSDDGVMVLANGVAGSSRRWGRSATATTTA